MPALIFTYSPPSDNKHKHVSHLSTLAITLYLSFLRVCRPKLKAWWAAVHNDPAAARVIAEVREASIPRSRRGSSGTPPVHPPVHVHTLAFVANSCN